MVASRLVAELRSVVRRGEVQRDVPMSQYTSFHIGGPADILVIPASYEEVLAVLRICSDRGCPVFAMGNGTNLLVLDGGIRGTVLKLDERLGEITVEDTRLTASAGQSLARVAAIAGAHSLSGLEFAAGIPGTVGGAVAMNAGAYGSEMRDILISARCCDRQGRQFELENGSLLLGYRSSTVMANGYIVLEATFWLRYGDKAEIKQKTLEFNRQRQEKQPLNRFSAGSTFKRPDGYYAGKLIEDAGLKGVCRGGAQVSEKHAGFIINTGDATAKDVIELIRYVQQVVLEKSGVQLETEVCIVGEPSDDLATTSFSSAGC